MAQQSVDPMALIHQIAATGLNVGDIDHDAVEQFIAGVSDDVPTAGLIKARDNMIAMIQRREKARGTNLPTMAATAARLNDIIIEREV